jgi:hypothetical protein
MAIVNTGKYLHKAVGVSIIIYHAIVDLLPYLVPTHETNLGNGSRLLKIPPFRHERVQRYNRHK